MFLLGIRHHGTGSARRVFERLEELRPDIVLVEGPPEFDTLLKWVKPGELEPPVAMLGYNLANPQQATFYPFAEYSPEWQAIQYANARQIPVRMTDLPLRFTFEQAGQDNDRVAVDKDPMLYLAELDGYDNSEHWWERKFEIHAGTATAAEHFEAVLLAMTTLREAGIPSSLEKENIVREAWMRQMMRDTQREMYHTIVVVCGAWHTPALVDLKGTEKSDKALLKQLPKTKINIGATWVPWTNERLGMQSGYGAGIAAPGWSEHRWRFPESTGMYWLSAVARLFRHKLMDISTAHVMEAQRLAHTLAALRSLPVAGLEEYNEATSTVMCMGDSILLDWVKRDLVVGHGIGKVPDKLPLLPLQADFEANIKKMRLKIDPEPKELRLDLREANDLPKSIFLHQVRALNIRWGDCTTNERSKGTFREIWTLEWAPEMMVDIIAKGPWGNTIQEAATAWLTDRARKATTISELTALIDHAFPGELFGVTNFILQRLDEMAALSTDVPDLMMAVQPFMRAMRYGNVRKTDKTAIENLLSGIIVRVCAGLPLAGYQLDEDAAQKLFNLINLTHAALKNLENADWYSQWCYALRQLDDKSNPLVVGCASRLLFEAGETDEHETAGRFSRALSAGYDPLYAASWIEGFLKGAGVALIYDKTLWNILFQWTETLPEEQFMPLLPILRRTFSQFEPADRRRIGEKAKLGKMEDFETDQEKWVNPGASPEFDEQFASKAVAAVVVLLGRKS
jgi:hypothetical protein